MKPFALRALAVALSDQGRLLNQIRDYEAAVIAHEVAHAVAFLAAEESGFITGSNLSVNGGQHMF